MAMNRSNYDYEEIVEHFGEDKLIARYETIEQYMLNFIERSGYTDKVVIASSVLNQALIDYFADIDRLKNFHHIDRVNYVKIHAYSAYWILRRKPIQIVEDNDEDIELAFVNENFVASYLMRFLREDNHGVVIKENDRQEYNEFVNNLKYVLRYRVVTAQMIETMIESYKAGRIFERSIGLDD